MAEKKADYTKKINHNNKEYEILITTEEDTQFSVEILLDKKLFGSFKISQEEKMQFDFDQKNEQENIFLKWAENYPEDMRHEWFKTFKERMSHMIENQNECFFKCITSSISVLIKTGIWNKPLETQSP